MYVWEARGGCSSCQVAEWVEDSWEVELEPHVQEQEAPGCSFPLPSLALAAQHMYPWLLHITCCLERHSRCRRRSSHWRQGGAKQYLGGCNISPARKLTTLAGAGAAGGAVWWEWGGCR